LAAVEEGKEDKPGIEAGEAAVPVEEGVEIVDVVMEEEEGPVVGPAATVGALVAEVVVRLRDPVEPAVGAVAGPLGEVLDTENIAEEVEEGMTCSREEGDEWRKSRPVRKDVPVRKVLK